VEEPPGPVAPDWNCILKWAWLRLRYSLDEQSVRAGVVCLAGGALSMALCRWPIAFVLPWLVAAAVAGIALIRRRREIVGSCSSGSDRSAVWIAVIASRNSYHEKAVAPPPIASTPCIRHSTRRGGNRPSRAGESRRGRGGNFVTRGRPCVVCFPLRTPPVILKARSSFRRGVFLGGARESSVAIGHSTYLHPGRHVCRQGRRR